MAPAGTQRPIVALVNAQVQRALGQAEVQQRFANLGMSPDEFDAFIKSEIAKWTKEPSFHQTGRHRVIIAITITPRMITNTPGRYR